MNAPPLPQVGVIGLGKMGSAMSRHFLAGGWCVIGFDVDPAPMAALEAAGGRAAGRVADLAHCPIVVSILWDDQTTRATARDLIELLPPKAIHVAMGTISKDLAAELHTNHAARGQYYLSAPVFGRPEAADTAKLSIMCAGPRTAFDQVEALLRTLGNVLWVGSEPFQANLLKLMGNSMIFSSIELLGEMFALLRLAGVSEADTKAAIIDPLFASPIFSGYADRIIARQWAPAAGSFELARKDNSLCLAAAESLGAKLPMVELMRARIDQAIAAGEKDFDISAIARRAAVDSGLNE